MKPNLSARLRTVSLIVFAFCSSAEPLSAEQFGKFTYREIPGGIEITDYPTTEVGEVVIPAEIAGKSVIRIGEDAFTNCIGLTGVTFPSSLTAIASSAFDRCTEIASITIPAGVISIGGGAFYECSGLTQILVEDGNPHYTSPGGILFNAAQTELIQYPVGRQAETYTIPPDVTHLGDGAFAFWGTLTSITIPAGVTHIGGSVFAGCGALEAIDVAAGNSQYVSIDGMLFDAAKTTLIQYPAGKIGPFTLPASLTSIGGGAFGSCKGLISIVIPQGVTSIGDYAFDFCTELTSITIPESVTSIGKGGFSYTGLTGVTLPSGITTIANSAFRGCSGLTRIIIPEAVTSIESGAFHGCSGLTSAVFLGDAPSLGWSPFEEVAPEFTVYYFNGKADFTSPIWTTPDGVNYPAVNMGAESPTKPWLIANGFDFDADLQADPNGDGVSLLLAYALDLDPNDNLAGRMPKPVFAGNQMTLTFHAASPGITYAVQTSTDLRTWTMDGVSLSALAPDHTRTATVDRLSPARFIRLVVTD